MADFKFEVTERIGVLHEAGEYTTEVNRISWNGSRPKIDIRKWHTTEAGKQAMKGITLTDEEAKKLVALLSA